MSVAFRILREGSIGSAKLCRTIRTGMHSDTTYHMQNPGRSLDTSTVELHVKRGTHIIAVVPRRYHPYSDCKAGTHLLRWVKMKKKTKPTVVVVSLSGTMFTSNAYKQHSTRSDLLNHYRRRRRHGGTPHSLNSVFCMPYIHGVRVALSGLCHRFLSTPR